MLQIATGDAWYSGIARNMRGADGGLDLGASAFFASYMLIVGVVLLNIVVAVLLDEFINTVMKERAEAQRQEDEKKKAKMECSASPLLPLLLSLQHFHSQASLHARVSDYAYM